MEKPEHPLYKTLYTTTVCLQVFLFILFFRSAVIQNTTSELSCPQQSASKKNSAEMWIL